VVPLENRRSSRIGVWSPVTVTVSRTAGERVTWISVLRPTPIFSSVYSTGE
jgi:hypothetical protein